DAVADPGGEVARQVGVAGQQGERGGVDAGEGVAAQLVGLPVEVQGLAEPGGAGGAVGGAGGGVLADAPGEAEGVAAELGSEVGAGEQFPDKQGGAGGVAAVGQGEGAAVEQVVVVGVEFVQPAGG